MLYQNQAGVVLPFVRSGVLHSKSLVLNENRTHYLPETSYYSIIVPHEHVNGECALDMSRLQYIEGIGFVLGRDAITGKYQVPSCVSVSAMRAYDQQKQDAITKRWKQEIEHHQLRVWEKEEEVYSHFFGL